MVLGRLRMLVRTFVTGFLAASACLLAQDAAPKAGDPGWRRAEEAKYGNFLIAAGTKVPLALINSVSTKHSAEGDRVYLETVFPVLVNGRIVVPVGSYVAGTVTQLKN